jgi:predicted Zn-ribbon and HTH transcriptional regulator
MSIYTHNTATGQREPCHCADCGSELVELEDAPYCAKCDTERIRWRVNMIRASERAAEGYPYAG